jgi:hypothetical protein
LPNDVESRPLAGPHDSVSQLIDEIRPEMPTSFPQYCSGLGRFVHPKQAAEMSYAVTDGSYGANGASGGIVWIDPRLKSSGSTLLITSAGIP